MPGPQEHPVLTVALNCHLVGKLPFEQLTVLVATQLLLAWVLLQLIEHLLDASQEPAQVRIGFEACELLVGEFCEEDFSHTTSYACPSDAYATAPLRCSLRRGRKCQVQQTSRVESRGSSMSVQETAHAPLVEVDSRKRVSLSRFGVEEHARYLVALEAGGRIVLTPAVVMSETEAKFLAHPELVAEIRGNLANPHNFVSRKDRAARRTSRGRSRTAPNSP